LIIELYNRANNPDYSVVLANTHIISKGVENYSFDFPAIDTYTYFVGADSTTNILNDTFAETEEAIFTPINTEIKRDLVVGGKLTSNSLTATTLNVEGEVNIDTRGYFDTIVIRRLDLTIDTINLNELQFWVNGSNILIENSGILDSYFADWSVDKDDTGLPSFQGGVVSKLYNNVIEGNIGTHTGSGANALVIKHIPSTDMNKIQALVLYNRTNTSLNQGRAIGLAIELYNEANDPDLIRVLANTIEITTASPRYRFDFPSINTYSSDDFVGADSITNIVNDSIAET